ncbi:hypothetical protein HID58_028438 [Brassica napus]|uniref:Uncharacterized protein n=1 Tax=Brassica napus TaxID=3708 RepID=A0ABQ8CA95_BRANA|nr:hypothetical protein HID58_028438 [Brassica napus]
MPATCLSSWTNEHVEMPCEAKEAEQQLEGLISCAVASASTKMREVELLSCTKKTRKSYDNMVTKLRWEAACVGNSDSRRALYNNSAPFFVRGLSHDREEIGEEKCCLRAIRFGVRKYVSNWFLSCVCVWLYKS